MFETIRALNPRENATLAQGRSIVGDLIAQGISSNPVLYATQQGEGAGFVPEKPDQDNSAIQSAPNAVSFPIASGSLIVGDYVDPPAPVPDDQPIDLGVWVRESGGGQGNMCGIADILRWGSNLRGAVGVK